MARAAIGDGRWESATLDMRMSGGAMVQSFFSLAATEDDHIEIYGRSGKLRVDRHLSLAAELRGATNRTAASQVANVAQPTQITSQAIPADHERVTRRPKSVTRPGGP